MNLYLRSFEDSLDVVHLHVLDDALVLVPILAQVQPLPALKSSRRFPFKHDEQGNDEDQLHFFDRLYSSLSISAACSLRHVVGGETWCLSDSFSTDNATGKKRK